MRASFVYGSHYLRTPTPAEVPEVRRNALPTMVETSSLRNTGKCGDASERALLREAQQHLERARALDPEGVVAQVFIRRVRPPS